MKVGKFCVMVMAISMMVAVSFNQHASHPPAHAYRSYKHVVTAPAVSTHRSHVAYLKRSSTRKYSGASQERSVGIDLGTTYSLVSIIEDAKPKIIAIDGANTVPSVVAFDARDGSMLVGEAARKQETQNPLNTFSSVKRVIGKTVKEVKRSGDKLFSSRVTYPDSQLISSAVQAAEWHDSNYSPLIALTYTTGMRKAEAMTNAVLAETLSSLILQKLIQHASAYFGPDTRITRAVITVPAYFTERQRKATEFAGKLAGLSKIRILKEPEAAALAYGLDLRKEQLVLVFDLGGGTLDVSVLEVGNGFVEVIATSGDGHLGGDDFDAALLEWMVTQFESSASVAAVNHLRSSKDSQQLRSRMLEAAVEAKKTLTSQPTVDIVVPNIYQNEGLNVTITRRKFEGLIRALLVRMLKPLREAALMAGINLPGESGQEGINEWFQPTQGEDGEGDDDNDSGDGNGDDDDSGGGGMSLRQMKKLQQEAKQAARRKKKKKGTTTKELRRLQKSSGDTSLSLFPGGQAVDEVLLVGGATRTPAVKRLVRTLTGVQPQTSVHPDEAICLGAGVQAGILDGSIQNMQVMSPLQAAVLRTIYEESLKGNALFNEFQSEFQLGNMGKESKGSNRSAKGDSAVAIADRGRKKSTPQVSATPAHSAAEDSTTESKTAASKRSVMKLLRKKRNE